MPQGSYADVVKRLRPESGEPGDIVDEHGRVLGRHPGIAHFTVGQRKRLGIAAPEPLYVLRLDAETRRVVVGPKEALGQTRIPLAENELARGASGRRRRNPRRREAALVAAACRGDIAGRRNAMPPSSFLTLRSGAVAPGQAAVLYDGDRVLGGGWIRRPEIPGPDGRRLVAGDRAAGGRA